MVVRSAAVDHMVSMVTVAYGHHYTEHLVTMDTARKLVTHHGHCWTNGHHDHCWSNGHHDHRLVKYVVIMDNRCLPMAILNFADHIVIIQIVENMVLMNTWTSCILAKSIVATMDK
jgi:hypothetical protein